ncbi:rhamnosyl transferase [Mesorhizobium sp. Root552]|nr:rhamnosyl transferase [Mesorhizobium sp. Root552]
MPVYEQWHLMPALLGCLELQTFAHAQFETILVDNGSTEIALPQAARNNLRVLHCETPGSYVARNRGAQCARGEWLVFTDADCRPAPEWLQTLHELAERDISGKALLAGAVQIVSDSPYPNRWEIYDLVNGIPQERYVRRGYGVTANLAARRSLFEALGGFDSARLSGGDADFCWRAGACACVPVYVSHARVDHPARKTREDVVTKARRVKGGQLTAGSRRRRLVWTLVTFLPPASRAWRLLRTKEYPLKYRLTAICVLLQMWIVEMKEAARLWGGGQAERR